MIDSGGYPGEALISFNALVTVTPYSVATNDGRPSGTTAGTPITEVPVRFSPETSSKVYDESGILVTDAVTFMIPSRYASTTLTLSSKDRITHNGNVYDIIGTPVLQGGVSGAYRVFGRLRR